MALLQLAQLPAHRRQPLLPIFVALTRESCQREQHIHAVTIGNHPHRKGRPVLSALRAREGIHLTSAQSLLFADLPLVGARQADLARNLGVSRQAVNELVKGLTAEGLVEVVLDPRSGRSKLVRPTAAGRESIRAALETFTELEAELRSRIGEQRVSELRRALEADWGDPPR